MPHLQLQSVQALSDDQKTALNQEALSKALANATAQATALAGSKGSGREHPVQSGYVYYPYALIRLSGAVAKVANGTVFFGGTASRRKAFMWCSARTDVSMPMPHASGLE